MFSLDRATEDKVFRITTFGIGGVSLLADLLGIAKFVYDIVVVGNLNDVFFKIVVLTLVFIFGASLGIVSMRRFDSMSFPTVARLYAWAYLGMTCISYFGMAVVLNTQNYSFETFAAFVSVITAELLALAALHVIIDNHDVRIYSVPVLILTLVQLILIVYKYIFASAPVSLRLAGELLFFIPMTLIGSALLGDIGFVSLIQRIVSTTRETIDEAKQSNTTKR